MWVSCRALLLCLLTRTNWWSDVCLPLSVIVCTSSGWWYLSDMHVSLLTVNVCVCVWMGQFPVLNVRFPSGYRLSLCVRVCVCVAVSETCGPLLTDFTYNHHGGACLRCHCMSAIRCGQSGSRVPVRERQFSFCSRPERTWVLARLLFVLYRLFLHRW